MKSPPIFGILGAARCLLHFVTATLAAPLETEVDHLVLMVAEGRETPATAQVHLSAWCKEHNHNEFHASQLLKAKLAAATAQGIDVSSDKVPRLLSDYRKLEKKLGERLRYNTLKMKVELSGEPIDPSTAKLDLLIDSNIALESGREDVADIIVKLAKQRNYNPVVEYLTQVYQQHGDDTSILDGFAERYFGTTEPIHQVMIVRFLTAAVARAFRPGCKQDCVFILQGGQGTFKSTFLETLASEEWFNDSTRAITTKDDLLRLHRFWIVEWSELENVFKRSDISQVKAFISSKTDDIRPPYGRDSVEFSRPSIIVGSTNESQFLADTTGNRRFWVLPISKRPDIDTLKAERDRIWAAAVSLFHSGAGWHMTPEEEQQVDEIRAQFESADPWFDIVSDYVDSLELVTTNEIAEWALDLDKGKRNSGHERRISAILKQLGFKRTANKVAHKGSRKRVYKRTFPKF